MATEVMESVGGQQTEASKARLFKTHAARLLDMMVGWAEHVEATEDEFPDTLKSAELYGLYQDAAQFMLIDDLAAKREAVSAFLSERVVPLILRED